MAGQQNVSADFVHIANRRLTISGAHAAVKTGWSSRSRISAKSGREVFAARSRSAPASTAFRSVVWQFRALRKFLQHFAGGAPRWEMRRCLPSGCVRAEGAGLYSCSRPARCHRNNALDLVCSMSSLPSRIGYRVGNESSRSLGAEGDAEAEFAEATKVLSAGVALEFAADGNAAGEPITSPAPRLT